jgi:hypothetical protein
MYISFIPHIWKGGRDSSFGIATDYGMKGPGILYWWDVIFHTFQRENGAP